MNEMFHLYFNSLKLRY